MATFAVILPAAGQSSRYHDKNYKKPFAPLANKPVWLHSAEKFVNRPDVKQVLVVISPEDKEYFQFKFGANTTILGIDVIDPLVGCIGVHQRSVGLGTTADVENDTAPLRKDQTPPVKTTLTGSSSPYPRSGLSSTAY